MRLYIVTALLFLSLTTPAFCQNSCSSLFNAKPRLPLTHTESIEIANNLKMLARKIKPKLDSVDAKENLFLPELIPFAYKTIEILEKNSQYFSSEQLSILKEYLLK